LSREVVFVKIHQSELIRGKQRSIRNTFYSS